MLRRKRVGLKVKFKHQTDPVSHGIAPAAVYPTINIKKQERQVAFKYPRSHRVTGSPVVNVRQKSVNLGYTFVKILYPLNEKCVQIILLIIAVREL